MTLFDRIDAISTRRAAALLALLGAFAFAVPAAPAFAQDDDVQSLPDPESAQEESGSDDSGNGNGDRPLPETGLPAALLLLFGVGMLSAGRVVRPPARRRKTHERWWFEVERRRYRDDA